MYNFFFVLLSRVFFAHRKSGVIVDFAETRIAHKSEIAINFSVYVYMSKNLQIESTTFRARIMNYNQFADKATIYFEWQTDFGRWVKINCITMSLFIVILLTFFM